ncbi:hypothetical protein SLEP1_g46818 [Rubroshorea leprosula]|uniref:Uncharacterized protein n=1 Tax=Rubroshorea leprosula TaxID=152421 RepID=A0AAV5LP76_9ROSI|nr:hypothetical protein SLEP1_g46818 [Rubroshorea leprosula]
MSARVKGFLISGDIYRCYSAETRGETQATQPHRRRRGFYTRGKEHPAAHIPATHICLLPAAEEDSHTQRRKWGDGRKKGKQPAESLKSSLRQNL